jgi:hypothetical protein
VGIAVIGPQWKPGQEISSSVYVFNVASMRAVEAAPSPLSKVRKSSNLPAHRFYRTGLPCV